MKIQDKVAKYRCPNCKEVYKYTKGKQTANKVIGVFTGFVATLKDIKNGIVYKFNNAKTTYKYMSSMKKNMKNNPDWSNYHKEQKETKEMNKKQKFQDLKDKFKKKK